MSNDPKRLPSGPGPGRPPGMLNKLSREIKEGVISGLLTSDYARDPDNADAPGTIQQYFKTVANKHPELFFSQAVTKLIPKEVRQHLQQDTTIISYTTTAEVIRAMEVEGLSEKQIAQIKAMLPMPLEPEDKEQT